MIEGSIGWGKNGSVNNFVFLWKAKIRDKKSVGRTRSTGDQMFNHGQQKNEDSSDEEEENQVEDLLQVNFRMLIQFGFIVVSIIEVETLNG